MRCTIAYTHDIKDKAQRLKSVMSGGVMKAAAIFGCARVTTEFRCSSHQDAIRYGSCSTDGEELRDRYPKHDHVYKMLRAYKRDKVDAQSKL